MAQSSVYESAELVDLIDWSHGGDDFIGDAPLLLATGSTWFEFPD